MSSSSKKKEKSKDNLSEETKNEIKTQIEYYLGDENLKKDDFFHRLISADANGYLDLDIILKCNKIKKKGWTKDEEVEKETEKEKEKEDELQKENDLNELNNNLNINEYKNNINKKEEEESSKYENKYDFLNYDSSYNTSNLLNTNLNLGIDNKKE